MIDKAKLVEPKDKDPKETTTKISPPIPNRQDTDYDGLLHIEHKHSNTLLFDVTVDDLLQFVKGPDFPTHGIIYGAQDIKQVYSTGRGKILIRGLVEDEDLDKGRTAIIIKQLPYQVNKATLVEKIAHLESKLRILITCTKLQQR